MYKYSKFSLGLSPDSTRVTQMRKRQTGGGAQSRKYTGCGHTSLQARLRDQDDNRMEYIGISVELKAKKFEQSRQR